MTPYQQGVSHMSKVNSTINTIKQKFLEGFIITLGLSGKDSACVAHCAVEALKQARDINPNVGPLCLVTTDTSIENIEIHKFIKTMHQEALEYAEDFDLPIESHFLGPSLAAMPMYEYIGKGKLIRTPQNSTGGRDCAISWKVLPMASFLKELKQRYQTNKVLSFSGSRDDESAVRARNIAKRGETIDTISSTDLGLTMAPIKNWNLQNVWSLIGGIEDGHIDSFAENSAKGLRKHYSAGNAGVCDIFIGKAAKNKACGNRFGCTLCLMSSEDTSLVNQINTDKDKYGYMQSMNDLRTFMANTLNDMERSRSLMGRDFKAGGWIKIGFNQTSMAYRKELLWYVLTIDAKEMDEASRKGVEARFQYIDYEMILAIQFAWSREGGESSPGEALQMWHAVHTDGKRVDIPKTTMKKDEGFEFFWKQGRYLSGDTLPEYRYLNLIEFSERICGDVSMSGLSHRPHCKDRTKYRRIMDDDGAYVNVPAFLESNKFSVPNLIKAEQFVEETFPELVEMGLLNTEEWMRIDPTEMLKIMLDRQIISIRKGSIKNLHAATKRAQVINAITRAGKYFETVMLIHSISKEDYENAIEQVNPITNPHKNEQQLALAI